jgi:NAD(P)H-dependent FMN reductase
MNESQAIRILGISGSLRSASFSTAILNALQKRSMPRMEFSVETLKDIPFYNEDLDVEPALPPITNFRSKVAASDGIVIATPEYNHGIPGVLKNALDWASRPAFASCVRVLRSRQTCPDHQFRAGLHWRSASPISTARDLGFDAGPSDHGARDRCGRRERKDEPWQVCRRGEPRFYCNRTEQAA